MINSNDIFSQIGLIVNPKTHNQQISFKEQPKYTAFLEIQLGEDQKHVLEIKDNDDPYELAQYFCREHRLNRLAVTLVQKKIIEAKNQQQQKLRQSKTVKHVYRQQTHTKTPPRPRPKKEKKETTPPPKKKLERQDSIYIRSVIKSRITQEERERKLVERENQQKEELTFKPKINSVSEKIVQFLKNNDIPKNKKMKPDPNEKLYQQLQQCTFQPKINKVSERIANNRTLLREEREMHRENYGKSEIDKSKSRKKIVQKEQKMFHPQINPKSADKVTIPFEKRLEIAVEKKHQLGKSTFYEDEECSFQPKVGRPPKARQKQNNKVWDNLYKNSRKEASHVCPSSYSSKTPQQSHSTAIYENLVDVRIRETFQALDNNGDGYISPHEIGLQQVPQGTLVFLKPIFQEMDEIDATLNFGQFRKAVISLLADTDPAKKGLFLSEKWWVDKSPNDDLFKPKINKKSRALTNNRSSHDLYKDGVRDIQAKQERLQRERVYRQQKQLAQCSFQPSLNHSSKLYMQKISRKKGVNNDKSLNQIIHSFMRESQ